jgi:hypothetical protein
MSNQLKWRERREEQAARRLIAETSARPMGSTPPFSRALQKAIQPILKAAGPSPGTLAAQWPEIVGARLAAITHPIRVQPAKGGSTLHVRAPSAAAPMLQHAQEAILQKVRLATGHDVRRLKIDQTVVATPAPRAPRRKLSAEERAELQAQLTDVRSKPLSEALAGLGEAVMTQPEPRRKKR